MAHTAGDRRSSVRGLARAEWALAWAVLLGLLSAQAGRAEPRRYRIVPQESAVRVLVYREGVFSVLAHDHVMLGQDVAGQVTLDPADIARSAVSLTIGVAGLQVDLPAERQRAQFFSELTDGNRASIREAMLGPEVLDAAASPAVTAVSQQVGGRLPALSIAARVTVRGKERVVTVPAQVEATAQRLTAKGAFEIKQSDFGITPYTALLGAIAVKDTVRVEFDLAATAQP